MTLQIKTATQFKRDLKRCQKQNKDMSLFKAIHDLLIHEMPLPPKNRDHLLTGEWRMFRECHITPDWLLIYRIEGDTLEYARMGSHAELFD